MWIPKGATLIRGRCLLQKIRYLKNIHIRKFINVIFLFITSLFIYNMHNFDNGYYYIYASILSFGYKMYKKKKRKRIKEKKKRKKGTWTRCINFGEGVDSRWLKVDRVVSTVPREGEKGNVILGISAYHLSNQCRVAII